ICLEKLGRYAEALDATAALLRKFGAQMPADERAQAEAAAGRLRASVGEIEIDAGPGVCAVAVDGRARGSTPLPGPVAVDAGTHGVRVSREGHETFEAQVVVAGGQRKRLQATLRPLRSGAAGPGPSPGTGGPLRPGPAPEPGFRPHLYLQAAAGGALAPSFGGSADARCAAGDCSSRARPLGLLAGARVGYRLSGGLGLELFAGYAYLKESATRQARAESETIPLEATDYRDTTSLSAP